MKWWMKIGNWLGLRNWRHTLNIPIPYDKAKRCVKIYSCRKTDKGYAHISSAELSISVSRERLEELAGVNEPLKKRYTSNVVDIKRAK